MKTTFKPLGLAAAVATASAGYAGLVNAVELAGNSGLGDMAIVPYYTVNTGYSTGVSVINTSDLTQVVKIRLRRAVDSMDALDFNVILSPWDVYTGYVQLEGDEFRFYSNDNSCTAPRYNGVGGQFFVMPNIFRDGAEEGYIEIMGMAAADASQPISVAAKHSGGVPFDCDRVRDNFFPGDTVLDYGTAANLSRRGVIDSTTTHQYVSAGSTAVEASTYVDTGNVLKVSYFIRDEDSGTEFGNDAVHFADFMEGASMTNQRFGLVDGDLQGFDFPDLNGGAVFSAVVDPIAGSAQRGRYELLRGAIGGVNIINDWSRNTTDLFSVDTDWVVTAPGQYLMANRFLYQLSLAEDDVLCNYGDPANAYDPVDGANCDFRDIPMKASVTVYDREEQGTVIEEGDLVVSPQPPAEIIENVLDQEVNVVQWGEVDVLGANKTITVPTPAGAQAGWANLAVTQNGATVQAICDFTDVAGTPNGQPTFADPIPVECLSTATSVPLVGFVAWQRNFAGFPEANYGRIVEHSYSS
jgi:hypothetical protein